MRPELEKKVDFAIKLLQSIPTDDGPIELSFSGGKDSDVILELAKMAGIPYRAIYKNTTIDPKGTIAHAREMGAEVIRPKKTFFQLISEHGFPSRFQRFCCSVLKEYKICDRAIQGIRRSESRKRAENYKEPEMCRVYSAKEKVKVYLPILEWTDQDVEEFIKERNIKCHPLYYWGGQFDVTKRLGCVGCPLQSRKKRIQEFKDNPKMLKAWIRAGQKRYTSEKYQNGKAKHKFKDAFEVMGYMLYCDNIEDFKEKTYTLFGEFDWKEFLQNEFKIDMSDI
ncbi:MAG: phosphoadenosine phosphosulfate reductase family protein [Prevotella sp.]|nr:phosphoadenosine phosphosulfate reductase family protein [Prevotella sp.]